MSALFEVAAPCGRCGRVVDETGSCLWCATAPTGIEAAERAMAGVNRDPEWAHRAARWIGDQPIGSSFTADHLIDALGLPEGSENQVGATIRAWSSAKIIRPEGVTKARRKESHGRLIRVWKVAR